MALNKGIWDPKRRGTNIKGTNLQSLILSGSGLGLEGQGCRAYGLGLRGMGMNSGLSNIYTYLCSGLGAGLGFEQGTVYQLVDRELLVRA